jgi:hypothetical protein
MTEVENLNGQNRLLVFDSDGKTNGAEERQRASQSIAHLEKRLQEVLIGMSEEERPTTLSVPTSLTSRMTPKLHGRSRSVPRELKLIDPSRELTIIETQARTHHKQRNNGKSHPTGDKVSMTKEESSIDHHRRHNTAKQIGEFLRSLADDHHSSGRALGEWNRKCHESSYRSSHPDYDVAIYKRAPMSRSPRPMRNTRRHEHISSRQNCQRSGGESMTSEESRRGNRGQLRHNNGVAKSFYYSTSDRQTSDRARGECPPRQRWQENGVTERFHSSTKDRQTSRRAHGESLPRQRCQHNGATGRVYSSTGDRQTSCRARGDIVSRHRQQHFDVTERLHSSARIRQISCQAHGRRRHNCGGATSFHTSASGRQKSGQACDRDVVRRRSKSVDESNHHSSPFHPDNCVRQKSGRARDRYVVRRRSKSLDESNQHFPTFYPDNYAECYRRVNPSRPLRLLSTQSHLEHNEKFSHGHDNADDHITVDSVVSKLTIESVFTDESPRSIVISDNNDSFLIRC